MACFQASLRGFVGLVVTGAHQRLVVDESSCGVTHNCRCDGSLFEGTVNACVSSK